MIGSWGYEFNTFQKKSDNAQLYPSGWSKHLERGCKNGMRMVFINLKKAFDVVLREVFMIIGLFS